MALIMEKKKTEWRCNKGEKEELRKALNEKRIKCNTDHQENLSVKERKEKRKENIIGANNMVGENSVTTKSEVKK